MLVSALFAGSLLVPLPERTRSTAPSAVVTSERYDPPESAAVIGLRQTARKQLEAVRVPVGTLAQLGLGPERGPDGPRSDPDGRIVVSEPEVAIPNLDRHRDELVSAGFLAGHIQVLERRGAPGHVFVVAYAFTDPLGAVAAVSALTSVDPAGRTESRAVKGAAVIESTYSRDLLWSRGDLVLWVSVRGSQVDPADARRLRDALAQRLDARALRLRPVRVLEGPAQDAA